MESVLRISDDNLTVVCCDRAYSGEIIVPEGINPISLKNKFKDAPIKNEPNIIFKYFFTLITLFF